MSEFLERYYSALLTRGRADNPTIGEVRRDLRREWLRLVTNGGVVRL